MFKNPFQIAIVFAIIALVSKLILFSLGVQHDEIRYIVYIYMMVMLVAVFFGVRSSKLMSENGKTTFGQDFKAGARTASFLAILIAVITYVYYAKIDAGFADKELESYKEQYKDFQKEHICSFSLLPENKTIAELSEEDRKQFDEDIKDCINSYPSSTNAKGIEKAKEDFQNRYMGKIYSLNPYYQASTTMFSMVLLGLMHSVIMTLLTRKMDGVRK